MGISRLAGVGIAVMLWLGCCSAGAVAQPLWAMNATSDSTAVPGGQLTFHVDLLDLGEVNSDGTPYSVTATLPVGMTGVSADGSASGFSCPGAAGASMIVCTATNTALHGILDPLTFTVAVDSGAAGVLTARFDVVGGGAAPASTVRPVTVTSRAPSFGIDAFDAQVTADASGTPFTQAAGHPFEASTAFEINSHTDPSVLVGDPQPVEPLKDATVDLPAGFVGDPTGVPQCTSAQLSNTAGPTPEPLCSPASQVGTATVLFNGQVISGVGLGNTSVLPVFNLVPPPNVPARFGINAAGSIIVFDAGVRSGGDYGLTVRVHNVPEGLPILGTSVTFWGVPSDSSHDFERACSGVVGPGLGGPSCTSGEPARAFLRNPTSCTDTGVGLPTTLSVDSWFNPTSVQSRTVFSHALPAFPLSPADWGAQQGPTGCASVPFDPTLSAQPVDGSSAGAPAGMAFDITLPQSDDPTTIGESDLKKAVVTLPVGVRVSPASADGLAGCNSAQIALNSGSEPMCPDTSKLGDVTIDTPLLDVPVTGGIYLATPFDNPFNSLVAVYLVASAKGVVIKVPGQASLDPTTGQITTTFDNNPQLPFSRLHLEFKAGPRAPLTLPNACATYTTTAEFTGWSGKVVDTQNSFTLTHDARGNPCPSAFSPRFSAGTVSNTAGSTSSFALRLTRQDEDQDLSGLTVHMPSGLTGKVASAVLCSNADAANGTCPDGTKIGDVTVGAGAGPNPFYITNGRAYITGPYKGAPFGLSIVVPAVAGPFNLGNVNVRSALFVDKHDATLRVVTDPLPTILQGIPLDVRDIRVNIDKPNFIVNSTSCAVKSVTGVVASTAGATANVSDRYQAAECASLGFKPKMVLAVGGKGHLHRGAPTPFTTRVTMPRGDANLRFVRVTLPNTIDARLTVINDACTRAQFENDVAKCAHAKAGTAVAVTPLLRDPLRGNVYFVRNGHPIPDLFIALRGQVAFDLIGRVTIPGGTHLATTFDAAPDVPLTSFTLRLAGDRKHGSVGAAADLCSAASKKQKAALDYIGQNGKVDQVDQALLVHGCAKPKPKRASRRR